MRVGLIGDVHGSAGWLGGRLLSLGTRGYSIAVQLGDLGIWPGLNGRRFLDSVEKVCSRAGLTLVVVPGNHDDWGQIADMKLADRGLELGEVGWFREHVAVLPRGHRWSWSDRSFCAVSGAPSLDRQRRTEGVDWWPGEAITNADVDRIVADGPADALLSHDAPGLPYMVPTTTEIVLTNPMGWDPGALAYAAEGRSRMSQIFEAVQPRVAVHGHYHVHGRADVQIPGVDHVTTVLALAADGSSHAEATLDIGSLTVDWVRR